MIIGVPRERKTLEKRVAITPDGAHELVKRGHKVLIEKSAGLGSFFADDAYANAGCKICDTLKEVWTEADMIVKVKEPDEAEFAYFRPGLVLFDYLHLAGLPTVAKALVDGKVTGIAYELVQTEDKRLPLLEPMSEVAGKLSVLNGSYFLLSQNGGRGVLLGGTIGVRPGNVVIIGAGISGRAACEVAVGIGANVTVLDIDYQKLEKIKVQFGNRVKTLHSTKASIERECAKADLLIGAVLVPGAAAPKLITKKMIQGMSKGSVFVDISMDQGGMAETSKATTLDNPAYVEEGVIHYGVCNMPAQTPRTSTMALTAATLPYVVKLADLGVDKALSSVKELRVALNTYSGHLTNKLVGDALGMDYVSVDEALKKG